MGLRELLKSKKWIALDTETYGNIKEVSVYDPSISLAYVSWWTSEGKGGVIHYKSDPRGVRNLVGRAFRDRVCIFWNAKFDLTIFDKEDLRPQRGAIIQDAMLLAQTLHPLERRFSLKHFAPKFLKSTYASEDALKAYLKRHKCDYGSVPMDVMRPYALDDAQYTFELFYLMVRDLTKKKLWDTWELETLCLSASQGMMKAGITIDHQRVEELTIEAQTHMRKLKKTIVRLSGVPDININSPAQIAAVLWPPPKQSPILTPTGKPSTSNLALLLDGSKLALTMQEYRRYTKALSTYYKPLRLRPVHGILHCSLNQNQAITGRYSASEPNLQNQPRASKSPLGRIRECYIARPGRCLVMIDFDQIEMRLLAHFAQEEPMLQAILDGDDLHGLACTRQFNLKEGDEDYSDYRYVAKRLNFATVYGTGARTFADTILEDTGGAFRIDDWKAREYIDNWWTTHPAIDELRNRVLSEIARTGGVRTGFGRYIPVQSFQDHASLNYLVQGTAADVIKRAIIRVFTFLRKERARTLMLLPVHDELIFDMPREEKHLVPSLVALMEDRTSFDVPLTCSVEAGLRWGKKTKVTL